MKERPILFKGRLVRRILADAKTQTRRIVKLPSDTVDVLVDPGGTAVFGPGPYVKARREPTADNDATMHPRIYCPYGYGGDRLWVKEAWQAIRGFTDPETGYWDDIEAAPKIPKERGGWNVVYAATHPEADYHKDDRGFGWRPSIFMPRWASRITLDIASVRVERLRDITEEDAKAEGVIPPEAATAKQSTVDVIGMTPHRAAFACLWNEINGDGPKTLADAEGREFTVDHSWDANPWVWAITFKRVEATIGGRLAGSPRVATGAAQ